MTYSQMHAHLKTKLSVFQLVFERMAEVHEASVPLFIVPNQILKKCLS